MIFIDRTLKSQDKPGEVSASNAKLSLLAGKKVDLSYSTAPRHCSPADSSRQPGLKSLSVPRVLPWDKRVGKEMALTVAPLSRGSLGRRQGRTIHR